MADVAEKHAAELDGAPARAPLDRLCELNVVEQVVNVCQTTIVHDAWARGQELTVHGLIYGLADGLLRDLGVSSSSPRSVSSAGRRSFRPRRGRALPAHRPLSAPARASAASL